jgi:hypothetical protein
MAIPHNVVVALEYHHACKLKTSHTQDEEAVRIPLISRRHSIAQDSRGNMHLRTRVAKGPTANIDKNSLEAYASSPSLVSSTSCPAYVSTNGFTSVPLRRQETVCVACGAPKQDTVSQTPPISGDLCPAALSPDGTLRPNTPAIPIAPGPAVKESLLHLQSSRKGKHSRSSRRRGFRESKPSLITEDSIPPSTRREDHTSPLMDANRSVSTPKKTRLPASDSNSTIKAHMQTPRASGTRSPPVTILARASTSQPDDSHRGESSKCGSSSTSTAMERRQLDVQTSVQTGTAKPDQAISVDRKRRRSNDWADPAEGWTPEPVPWILRKATKVAESSSAPSSGKGNQHHSHPGPASRYAAGCPQEKPSSEAIRGKRRHGRPKLPFNVSSSPADSTQAVPNGKTNDQRPKEADGNGDSSVAPADNKTHAGPRPSAKPSSAMPPSARSISSYRPPSRHDSRNGEDLPQQTEPELQTQAQARRDSASRNPRPQSRQGVPPLSLREGLDEKLRQFARAAAAWDRFDLESVYPFPGGSASRSAGRPPAGRNEMS